MAANNTVVFGFISAFQDEDSVEALELKIKEEWMAVANFRITTIQSSADIAFMSGQITRSYYDENICPAIKNATTVKEQEEEIDIHSESSFYVDEFEKT